jgi:hypothetical protein
MVEMAEFEDKEFMETINKLQKVKDKKIIIVSNIIIKMLQYFCIYD